MFSDYDINGTKQEDSLYSALACCLGELFKLSIEQKVQLARRGNIFSMKSM